MKKNNFKILLVFIFTFALVLSLPAVATVSREDIYWVNMSDSPPDGEGEVKKYVALTFDDGPHPTYTKRILDVLEEKNISATFFVVGFRAELHPDTILRMKSLNCEIGNHTYEHKDLKKISDGEALSQISNCDDVIFLITGEYPKVYRPPFGKISSELENKIDMIKVLWTIDSWDWKCKNDKSRVINNVIKNTKPNSVILMHDFFDVTLSALPEIIDSLRESGFEFKTVSELAELGCLATDEDEP